LKAYAKPTQAKVLIVLFCKPASFSQAVSVA
jgi:hypothetical protein